MAQRKVTVRWRHGKRGFTFLVDGSVNEKRTCYYITKRSLWRGTKRYMGDRPHTVIDETGVSYRGVSTKTK